MGLFSRLRTRKNDKELQQTRADRNDDVFRREENPALFDAVRSVLESKYAKGFYDDSNNYYPPQKIKFGDSLYGETLDNCTSLDLHNFPGGVDSLEGIGHLRNLRVLDCSGYEECDSIFEYNKIKESISILSNQIIGEITEEEYRAEARRIYDSKQIKDITPLYACKNLRKLGLNDQDYISEFDVGQFPLLRELSMQCCENLTSVTGFNQLKDFDEIFYNQKIAKNCKFDFSECNKLSSVTDIIGILARSMNQSSTVDYAEPVFNFPLNTFIRLANNKDSSDFIQDYDKFLQRYPRHDSINWTENSGSVTSGWNTRQAVMLKSRIDEITNTVCDPNDSTIQSLYNVYQWITTHVIYDKTGLCREKAVIESSTYLHRYMYMVDELHYNTQEQFDKKTDNLKELQQKNIEDKSNSDLLLDASKDTLVMRSAYVSLFDKKAVCVGVSNLFNAFAVNLGVNAKQCYCYVSNEKSERNFGHITNHQISIIDAYKSGNPTALIFDPTNDLGRKNVTLFGMGRAEADMIYELGIKSERTAIGESVYKKFNNLWGNSWLGKQELDFQDHVYSQHQMRVQEDDNNKKMLQEELISRGITPRQTGSQQPPATQGYPQQYQYPTQNGYDVNSERSTNSQLHEMERC